MATSAGRNPDGSQNYRYDEPITPELEISPGEPDLIDAVEKHLQSTFGNVADGQVFHEILSPTVHLDVHIVPPNSVLNAWTCMTSGMAELPMSPPPEALQKIGDCRYLELVTILPPDWPLFAGAGPGTVVGQDTPMEQYWPIGWMKFLARFPHEYGAWFWAGHTIPNGDPPEPFPGTRFVGSMLHYPVLLPESFWKFRAGDRTVHVMAVWPLHAEEMAWKLRRGAASLLERLERYQVTEMVDPGRPNAARKRFGLF